MKPRELIQQLPPGNHDLLAQSVGLWTATLYDADINSVNHSDFTPQAKAIAQKAIQNNNKYR